MLIFFLLVLLASMKANSGLPPTTALGQNQSPITTFNFQTPNNLATKVQGGTLLESGNTNILVNPSFEHQAGDTGWTVGGTATAGSEASVVVHGKKSYSFNASSQTVDISQSSTLYQAQFADGVQGLASIRVKTNHTGTCSVCSVQAGTVSTTNCVTVQANSKWGLYKVPMILGATSNGISLACTSGTGLTYVDDAFVGATQVTADVDQSRIAGESYFAGTTGCAPSRTNTAVGAFGTDADCPGPTIVTSTMGSWQTTDSDLIRQTINNLPAGTYKAKFIVAAGSAGADWYALAINDGTTTCEPFVAGNNNANTSSTFRQNIVECTFTYTSSGNRVFELYGSSASSAVQVDGQRSSPRASTKFILEYFGSGSVYTSTNADTDFSSATCTSSHTTNTTTTCKVRRDGGNAIFQFRNTYSGAPNAALLTFTLPSGYVIDANRLPSTEVFSSLLPTLAGTVLDAGTAIYPITAAYNNTTSISVRAIKTAGGTNPVNVTTNDGVSATVPITFGSGDFAEVTISLPIVGWSQPSIIIGQFNGLESCANTLECTDTLSAKVSTAPALSDLNVSGWASSVANSGTSSQVKTITVPSGVFTLVPNCTCTVNNAVTNNDLDCKFDSSTSTATSLVFHTSNNGAAGNFGIVVSCQKQGADYIGKTAKAVASDQNIATPGVTKVRSCMFSWGGSGSISSPTNCTSSPCTTYLDSCGSISGTIARSGQGDYNGTSTGWAVNTPVSCQSSSSGGSWTYPVMSYASDSSGNITIRTRTGASPFADSSVIMTCLGARP